MLLIVRIYTPAASVPDDADDLLRVVLAAWRIACQSDQDRRSVYERRLVITTTAASVLILIGEEAALLSGRSMAVR